MHVHKGGQINKMEVIVKRKKRSGGGGVRVVVANEEVNLL